MIQYLSIEDYRRIAAAVLGTPLEQVPWRDEGAADSALHSIQPMFGHDPFPDVSTKAAALCHRLAVAHPLADGNKRSATVAMFTFARMNKHSVVMPDDDVEQLIVQAAAGGNRPNLVR